MPRLIEPFMTYLDNNGVPLAGGFLQFNISGSPTVAKATFSDEAETTPNANPIPLDSAGRVPDTIVDVFGSGDYNMIVKNSASVEQQNYDPLTSTADLTTDVTGSLPIANGGTAATTASGARTNLGLGALAVLNTVDTAEIDADAVTTVKILDANVTLAKIADAAASDKLLGSGDAGSAAPYEEITIGTGLVMSGTTLSATGAGGRTKHGTVHTSITAVTEVEWLSIPAAVDTLELALSDISLSGTENFEIQLGSSGAYATSGYTGNVNNAGGNNSWTSGALLARSITAGIFTSLSVVMRRITGNKWHITAYGTELVSGSFLAAGDVTLAGELTRLKLKSVGTDNIDNGDAALWTE